MLYVMCGYIEALYAHNPLRSLHTPSPESRIIWLAFQQLYSFQSPASRTFFPLKTHTFTDFTLNSYSMCPPDYVYIKCFEI